MGSGTSVPHQMGSGTSVPKRRYLQIFKVKLFLAGCIVVHDLTVSIEFILVGDKSFETDRTPCVDLAGADTDLCTKSISETVGKSCGSVLVYSG